MGNREGNPYVGPRPFERDDRAYFFGRAREIRDVVSLVIAQPVLLLYAASGAGKSSLLNAGVLPTLEERGADVLPPGRVLGSRDPPEDALNVYAHALSTTLASDDRGDSSGAATLEQVLAKLPRPGEHVLRILVVDQFEELFTAYPGRWRERTAFFEQLREALEADPRLRLVLSIREDHLAQLDPLAALLPGGLRHRFRLERLDREGALAAVKNPIERTTRRFQAGVAETLVEDLLRFRVDLGAGRTAEVEGEYAEPVQLQVVCRDLWEELPPDADEITADHLRTFADVDEVLARFYREAVAAAVATRRVRERHLRRWIGEELITPGGTRGAVYGTEAGVGDMPREVTAVLVEKRLVRAEWRAGARWYELTHDRLIEPIRRSNAEYDAARRRRALRTAAVALVILAAAVTALATSTTIRGPAVRPGPPLGELRISALETTAGPSGVDVTFVLQARNVAAQAAVVRAVALDARTGSKVVSITGSVALPATRQHVSISLPDTAQIVRVRLSATAGDITTGSVTSAPVNRLPDLRPVFVSVRFTRGVIFLFAAVENAGALTAPNVAVAVHLPTVTRAGPMGRIENERIGGIAVEAPRPPGREFRATATADPDNAVAEANERNNSITVYCQAGTSACTKVR
jgi:hypothetical protein